MVMSFSCFLNRGVDGSCTTFYNGAHVCLLAAGKK